MRLKQNDVQNLFEMRKRTPKKAGNLNTRAGRHLFWWENIVS